MIRVKRIYEEASADDGVRVLVDRLWPRGVSKEDANLDEWMKEVAPSTELRQWYHGGGDWEEFRRHYLDELSGHPEELQRLRTFASEGALTLLYASRDEERNHAVVLKDVLTKDS